MLWRIPLADIDFDEEEYAAVESVLKSKWLTMGSVTQAFEADFCAFTGIRTLDRRDELYGGPAPGGSQPGYRTWG